MKSHGLRFSSLVGNIYSLFPEITSEVQEGNSGPQAGFDPACWRLLLCPAWNHWRFGLVRRSSEAPAFRKLDKPMLLMQGPGHWSPDFHLLSNRCTMARNCLEGERLDCGSEPISEPDFSGSFNIQPRRGKGLDACQVSGTRHVYVCFFAI